MKKKNLRSMIAAALVLMFSLACFVGCSQPQANGAVEIANGGVLCLKVNPEIAVAYDSAGNVTGVTARNDEALKILENYSGFEGKAAKTVVVELINAIGEAGYFVEEIDGGRRQITLEIEPGSSLPTGTFLDDVIANIRDAVNSNSWQVPLDVEGESAFGLTDYVDTDYGVGNDGVTNYTDYNEANQATDAAGNVIYTDYDATDYDATDYGKTNYTDYGAAPAQETVPAAKQGSADGKGSGSSNAGSGSAGSSGSSGAGKNNYTDYGKTDYNDPATDYGKTDYNDSVTDYGKTNYTDYGAAAKEAAPADSQESGSQAPDAGSSNTGSDSAGSSGSSSAGKTDYGKTDYGKTDYGKTDYGKTDYGKTNYD